MVRAAPRRRTTIPAVTTRASGRPRVAQATGTVGTPSFDVDDSKLQPPRPRSGIVTRTALLDRLVASPELPVVAVTAPAGYGKTTLLAQWAQRRHPRATWLSVDERDNDPAVLLTYLRLALEQLGKPRKRPIRPTGSPGVGVGVADVARLVSSTFAGQAPALVVLDNVEAAQERGVPGHGRRAGVPTARRLPAGDRLPSRRAPASPAVAGAGRPRRDRDPGPGHGRGRSARPADRRGCRIRRDHPDPGRADRRVGRRPLPRRADDQRRERPPRGW